ncbi:MAG: pantetheine-phosphate adenylyltransferase [Oscillospiraceae bacterium]|jgi:pantetheine-phosphate adenylyltransferase|nr:pantetheine-phosphate adenylyltransferase [Oscillospiraceae bacterium]
MRIAVCPGSFDPITVGHLDLAERAAAIFDRVILCVMVNGEKKHMFTLDERLELARAAAAHLPNVEAAACGGLLADFAREQGACALVKGVRGGTDLDWEMQLAQINRDLFPRLDTVLLPARPEHMHISSTMVREMLRYQQRLEPYIPSGAMRALLRIREGKV